MSSKVIFIHGLFGEETALNSKYINTFVSPYSLTSLESLKLENGDIIYAYSLGARVLLKIMMESKTSIPKIKINILSAHISLDKSQRENRVLIEDKIIHKMDSSNFNDYWNNLEIFKNDTPITINLEKIEFYKRIFNKFRLSKQKEAKSYIESYPEMFSLFWGELDLKIRNQYINTKVNTKEEFIDTSHRNVLNKIDYIHEKYHKLH